MRSEQEVREFYEAVKAFSIQMADRDCDCENCRGDYISSVTMVDTLAWLLREAPSPEFVDMFPDSGFDLEIVTHMVASHRLGEFTPNHS